MQAGVQLTASVTDSTDAEAEATLAELRSTAQRSDQEVVTVSRCPSHGGQQARQLPLSLHAAFCLHHMIVGLTACQTAVINYCLRDITMCSVRTMPDAACSGAVMLIHLDSR